MDTPTEPDERLEGHACPLDGKPCHAGSVADCKHFWKCVREAMQHREQGLAGDPPPDDSPGLYDAETG